MKLLIIGNRLLGDALDALHAIHSLVVYYEAEASQPMEYHFLGYQYSAFIHKRLMAELGLSFKRTFQLERYLSTPPVKQRSAAQQAERPSRLYPSVRLSWRALWELVVELRRERYELAFILPGGFIFAFITFFARIPLRIGHKSDGRSFLLTRSTAISKKLPNYVNNAKLLSLLRPTVPFVAYQPQVAEAEVPWDALITEAQAKPATNTVWQNYYIVATQASEPWRVWPGEYFHRVAAELAATYGLVPLWVGLEQEHAAIDKLRQGLGLNLAGRLSWDHLLALLARVRFLLTNDTGIAHIGTLLVHTFILFGPSNPLMARPYVSAKGKLSSIVPPACKVPEHKRKQKRYRKLLRISQLTPEQVLAALKPVVEQLP